MNKVLIQKMVKKGIFLDGQLCFMSGATEDAGQVKLTIETQQELYVKSFCKGCRYFKKAKGWMGNENPPKGIAEPMNFLCSMGQFMVTHNPLELPKQCLMKNRDWKNDQEIENQDDFKEIMKGFEDVKEGVIWSFNPYAGEDCFDVITKKRTKMPIEIPMLEIIKE